MKRIWMSILICAALAAGAFTGCANAATTSSAASAASTSITASASTSAAQGGFTGAPFATDASVSSTENLPPVTTGQNVPETIDAFTERDLKQEADLSSAKKITVSSGEDVTISEEGVYVLSGTAEGTTITINADDSAKVQLVLDGLTITNGNAPAIYVASADKVFITTAAGSTNTLSVTGEFAYSADQSADGAIYSKDDITLNGKGTLVVNSSANGVVGNDDVKVTGGSYQITASNHAIKGNDSVAIADGTFKITAGKDAIHSVNDDDQSKGFVYVKDGTFDITAASDGVEGDAFVKIDGGTLTIDAEEGIEGSYVQINGGTIAIKATDDGINASVKSNVYNTVLQINGGDVRVDMAQGDTDALDSNGSLIINGGTVTINAQFAFDFATEGLLNGGTVIVNGEQVTEITESMMMGGPGGMGGMRPDGSGEMPDGSWGGQQGGSWGGQQGGPRGGWSGQSAPGGQA